MFACDPITAKEYEDAVLSRLYHQRDMLSDIQRGPGFGPNSDRWVNASWEEIEINRHLTAARKLVELAIASRERRAS